MDNYRRGRQFNDPSSFSSSLPVLSSRSSLIMKDLLDLDGPSKLNSETRYSLTGNHGVMRSPMLPSNTYMGKGYSTYKAPLQHSGLNTEFTNDRHLRDGRSVNERFTGNLSARNISGPGNSRNISSHGNSRNISSHGNSRNISSHGNSRNFKGDHSRYHTHEDLGSISGFAEELYASGVISAGRMGVSARHRNEVDFEESKERFAGDSSISNYAGDLHTLDFPADSERLQSHVRQERLKRFGGDSVSDFAEDLFTSGFTGNSPGGLQSDLRHGKELDVEDARLKLKRLRGARNNSRHSDKVYESVVNSDLERLHSNGRHGNESNLPSLGNVSGISTGRSDMSRVIENDLEAPRSKVLKSHKNVDSFKESYQYKPSSNATPLDSVSVADFHLLEIIRKVQKAATSGKTIVAEKSKPFQAANATVSEEALDSFWKNVSHRLHEDQSKCRSGLNEILQLPEISKGLGVTECLDRDQLKYKPDYREILQSSEMSNLLYENDKRGHNSYAEELGHSSAREINEPLQNYPPYIEEYQGDWCGTVKQRLGVPSQKPAAPVKRGERTISLSPPRKEIWRISQPRKEIWRVSSPKKEILRKSPPRKETWRISSGVSQRHLGGSLRSRSPSLPRYRSPRRLRSRSPRRVRSRSPRRLRSRSPRRLRSRSPRRLRSRSPRRFKSRSPSLRSRSPRRLRGNRSRSPRRISRSPGRLRSRSPDFYSSRLPMRSSHDPSYSDRRSSRSLATVHSRTREKSPIISTPYQLVGALRLVKTAIISTGTSYMLEVSQGGVTEDIFGMPRTLKSTMLLKGFKLKFTALPFGRNNNNCKEGLVSLLEFAIENRYNHDVYVEARAHDDEMDIRDAKPYELAEYFRNTNVVIDFVSRDPLNDSKYKLKATHLKVPGNTDYKPRAGGVLHRLGKKSVLSRLGKQTNIKQRVSCEKEADVEEIYQDDIVAEEFDQEADVEEIDQDDMVAEGFDPEADVEEIYQDDIAAEEFDFEYDDGPLPVSFPSSMSKRLSRPLLQL